MTYLITQVGMPSENKKGHVVPPHIRAARAVILEEVETIRLAAENENKIIYFLPVPEHADLPEPPPAAILMGPTPYVPQPLPPSGPTLFSYDANLRPGLLAKMSSFKVF